MQDEICNVECTEEEIETYLKKLKVNKSPGPDTISPQILKECASQLAPSLAKLFNKSFFSGTLPRDWKIATIAPIHRKRSTYCM